MTVRENVEIDYCPKCRGIWLEKGELDKLLNTIATEIPQQPYNAEQNPQRQQYNMPHNAHQPQYNHDYDPNNPHRKKSTVERIFDIFD